MPFFVVDDGAHSHPKFMRCTNAAVGLWMRVGSYVAQHLTDGHVPGAVATMYGTAPQIKKLVEVGLWHPHAHVCPRCPQPRPGDFFMHDYALSGNRSRAQVLDDRARAAEKKRRHRAAQSGRDSQGNQMRFGDESQPNRERFDDDSSANESPDFDESAGHGDVSRGDSPVTSRARVPLHSTPLHKEGAEEREQSAGSSGRAPEPALSLISADWEPSTEDVRAAQLARSNNGRELLTPAQIEAVTRKFVQRQLDDGKRAAAWGGRWQQWVERERPDAGPVGGVVVVPFGQQQPTRGQQQRAGLARLMQQQAGEV